MPNNEPFANDITGLLHGPEMALGLFLFLVMYTAALRGTTARAQIPGLAWLTRRTIYADLVLGLGLLATVPAVALALVLISRAADQREERATELLAEASTGIAIGLDQYFEKHRSGIASLAASIHRAGQLDAISLTGWLESHHAIYTDYLTMLAANSTGDIITATTLVSGKPGRVETINQNIRDRAYFKVPVDQGGTYVSDVFKGRGLGDDPIIAVSALLRDVDGSVWGIVEGSLDLSVLTRFRPSRKTFGQAPGVLILDQHDRVIFSSQTNLFSTLETVDTEHLSADNHNRLHINNESALGWTIIASIPATSVHSQVWSDARITLLWLLAAILVAVMLSTAIARRVTQPLTALNQAVRALDLDGADADISPPPGAAGEIQEVFGYLNSMSERLHRSYRQLTAAIEAGKHYREQLETTLARRETEIHSRTKELEHSNRNLRTLSHVDQLTGLANRRRFIETANQLWRNGMREQSPVSIVIMDIDYFKLYNDTYGHQQGDKCLAQIGDALSACVWRPLDLVARYGGEEFIMILANTGMTDTLTVAERTRRVIENLGIAHSEATHSAAVTLSLGVAVQTPARNSDYNALIRSADRALYHAKEMGRNRTAWASDDKIAVYHADDLTAVATEEDHILEFRRAPKDS